MHYQHRTLDCQERERERRSKRGESGEGGREGRHEGKTKDLNGHSSKEDMHLKAYLALLISCKMRIKILRFPSHLL